MMEALMYTCIIGAIVCATIHGYLEIKNNRQ